ncbi:MAG: hypothetical protein IJC29_03265 [Clostridia bacterium]|nr:hypothetical protein [Clostridia bacterium]
MKKTLETLWYDYFSDECSALVTAEEKALAKRAVALHEAVGELLTREQSAAVEAYVDALYEIEGCFVKKAFLKGCEFATSFFFEAGAFGRG